MTDELSVVLCTSTHPITLEDGRPLGPGEEAPDVDVTTDYHRDLVAEGHLRVLEGRNVRGRRSALDTQTNPPEVVAALVESGQGDDDDNADDTTKGDA